MLVFQTMRSFSPVLVIESDSRTIGTPERFGHMISASTSSASEGVMPVSQTLRPSSSSSR